MTIEATAVGVGCNLSCPHCYQHPIRDAGHGALPAYDLPAMKAALLKQGRHKFTLFGGEALLMPFPDLKDIVEWGVKEMGGVSVQTNATLFTPEIHALFEANKVGVGISMDGPGPLNDSRWAGSLDKTRLMTQRSERAIDELCKRGMPPGLIVTLYRGNAAPGPLPTLLQWFRDLYAKGVRHSRLHTLDVNLAAAAQMLLSEEDLQAALGKLWELDTDTDMVGWRFDLFQEAVTLMRGERDGRHASCVWNSCDPYTTAAVQGVGPDGTLQNCGRAEKEGIQFVKGDVPSFERQVSLYTTPQSEGGCQGCRFFAACRGYCPGDAIDGDWRNRSAHCNTLKWMFGQAERLVLAIGETPISLDPKRPEIEGRLVSAWKSGRTLTLRQAVEPHLLRKPAPTKHGNVSHANVPHGNVPHGNSSR